MNIQKRKPEEIKNDVIAHLAWDSSLKDSGIHVDVVGGIVTLTGTVSTYKDLWEAEHDVRVIPGVSLVDNRLAVSPCVSFDAGDDEIRDRVLHVLEWSPAVDASRMKVTVKDHVVTLSGEIETYWQKSKARSLAADVTGVEEVVDSLAVEPSEGVTDEDIREAMDETIARMNLEIGAVDVSVHDGQVTLSGAVGDYRTYQAMEMVAGNTTGVVEVINNLNYG